MGTIRSLKIKLCPICGKPNIRGGNSKYCSGDCKAKADKLAQKKKNQEIARKRLTTLTQDIKLLTRGLTSIKIKHMLKSWQKPNPRRNKKILEYHKEGYSLNQIAGIFHLTKQRIFQIIKVVQKSRT